MSNHAGKSEKALDKALAESFPASDPVSLTREPKGGQAEAEPASRPDRKAPRVSPSAEAQPDAKH
jgi:hypothetical protein